MQPLHRPELDRRFRPLYPAALLAPLLARLTASPRQDPGAPAQARPAAVADLGAGTGLSALSLLRAAAAAPSRAPAPDPESAPSRAPAPAPALPPSALALTLIESDPAMAARAAEDPELRAAGARVLVARAEATGLPAASQDAILIGSAVHWMDRVATERECSRILRPGGALLAFEYQFPKALEALPLNEWIRRQFNERWRAPGQRPRGDFKSLLEPWARSPSWRLEQEGPLPMRAELDVEALGGLLFSQSRYLHFESALAGAPERENAREEVRRELARLLPGGVASFDFKLRFALWTRVSG